MSPLVLFLALVAGHALGDYPLQGDFLARAKNHAAPIPGVPWYQALTAHALIQGAIVAAITGRPVLGLYEFVAHWGIDWAKSDGRLGQGEGAFNVDQGLHVLTKVVLVWSGL